MRPIVLVFDHLDSTVLVATRFAREKKYRLFRRRNMLKYLAIIHYEKLNMFAEVGKYKIVINKLGDYELYFGRPAYEGTHKAPSEGTA